MFSIYHGNYFYAYFTFTMTIEDFIYCTVLVTVSVYKRQQIDYWYDKSCVLERWRCDNSEAELQVGGVDDEQHARDSMNDWRVELKNEALARELLSAELFTRPPGPLRSSSYTGQAPRFCDCARTHLQVASDATYYDKTTDFWAFVQLRRCHDEADGALLPYASVLTIII